jgi:hypothetical protein
MNNMNTTTKYPNIVVDLSRIDGNAFSIMGAVTREMKRGGVSREEIDAYRKEATSGDYNHLLAVTGNWVSVEIDADEYDYDFDDEDDDAY